jgi:hypothetical protein
VHAVEMKVEQAKLKRNQLSFWTSGGEVLIESPDTGRHSYLPK